MHYEYILDYLDEKKFQKIERSLKKYNMLAYKKLILDYYPSLKKGKFIGNLIESNEEHDKYELKLPTDLIFQKVHGDIKLFYKVNKNEKIIILENIEPSEILITGHKCELITYKGKSIFAKEKNKNDLSFDLLDFMSKK